MRGAGGLEEAYRRLLRGYPAAYRRQHEEEILGVLLAAARPGQRRPGAGESLDLLWSALKIRIRMILRGSGSHPWAAALCLVGVLLPLLMVLLSMTEFLDQGVQHGFGTPADFLVGAYGNPGASAQIFQFDSYSDALAFLVAHALIAGPVPPLIVAALACLGRRRAAATVAAFTSLAYLGIALTRGFPLLAGPFRDGDPRGDMVLYAYGLEALALLAPQGAPRGWRALRWRPGALLAVATVAAGVAINGGIWPLLHRPSLASSTVFFQGRDHHMIRAVLYRGFIDQLFRIGAGGLGNWLVYQGTLVAVIAVALRMMPARSPVSRRALSLLGIPLALGTVIYLYYLYKLNRPPLPPVPAGNTLITIPLMLILLTAMAVPLAHACPADLDAPSRPAPPGET